VACGELAEGLVGGDNPQETLFYMDPAVADTAFDHLRRLAGNDRRFFAFDPSRPDRDYNYNANELLVEAIRAGARGAYWDILRRMQ
jgi:hypothetical protein